MKTRYKSLPFIAAALSLAVAPASSEAQARRFKTTLEGIQEVGSVSTTAAGQFAAELNADGTEIAYMLQYSNLEGNVTQAHIHLGQLRSNGGISIWLCQTATNMSPVATTPFCTEPTSGTVQGTITAADVVGPAGQGVAAGEFEEIAAMMLAGATYANVHSSKFPGGEIRGQIRPSR
jgi:hypothetical protein